MDHPCAVDRVERRGDPHRQRLQVAARQRPLLAYGLGQVGSAHVLRDEVRDVPLDAGVEHGGRAEPRHAPRGRDLTLEAPPEGGVADELRMDHLHRGQAAGRGGGEVDHAHAAPAQLTPEHVSADRIHRSHPMVKHLHIGQRSAGPGGGVHWSGRFAVNGMFQTVHLDDSTNVDEAAIRESALLRVVDPSRASSALRPWAGASGVVR